MGKKIKSATKVSGKYKTKSSEKARSVGKSGRIKRKRGDSRSLTQYAVVQKVLHQKKGGKSVYGERRCAIHSVCDCVTRGNPVAHYRVMSGEGDNVTGRSRKKNRGLVKDN